MQAASDERQILEEELSKVKEQEDLSKQDLKVLRNSTALNL